MLDRSHGGRWGLDLLDFSFMVNLRFPVPAMLAAMRHAVADLIGAYGSAQPAVDEKLSWLLGCSADRLVTLAGASQAYPVLGRRWATARVAIPEPAFGEYRRVFPGAVGYADRPGAGIDLDALDALAHDVEVLVVVNPGNPTGTSVDARRLHALAAAHPATTLLVDESFAGFAPGPTMRDLLEAAPLRNVLVLTSLGKTLGVSGIRLGYAYGHDRALLDALAGELPIWSLSSQAEHFLELTLKFRPELEASLRQTIADREALRAGLAGVAGVATVHPSGGNFVLVDLDGPADTAARTREALLVRDAIAIKDVTARFPDRVPRVRLGVRLPAENERLIVALGDALSSVAAAEGR
jgi:histidinol-phosphate/aromatic aminotransferase/cobyric acid decarboxylase-like protein